MQNKQIKLGGHLAGFLDPEAVVFMLELAPGQKVADFGAGIGRYSIPMAKAVAPNGKVYAVDIQEMLLQTILSNAQQENIPEDVIVPIHADMEKPEFTGLNKNSLDLVLIANTLFLMDNKEVPIKEAARILKGGGRLVVIDWIDSFSGLGPPKDMLVSQQEVVDMAESSGFLFEQELPPAQHHYILVFKKDINLNS